MSFEQIPPFSQSPDNKGEEEVKKPSKDGYVEKNGTQEEKEKLIDEQNQKEIEDKIEKINTRRKEIDEEYEKLDNAEFKIQPEHKNKQKALEKEYKELSDQIEKLTGQSKDKKEKPIATEDKETKDWEEKQKEMIDNDQEETSPSSPEQPPISPEENQEEENNATETEKETQEQNNDQNQEQETDTEATEKPEINLEKTQEKIVSHFNEELLKLEAHPKNTEPQKRKNYELATELLNHWLPFGHIDDFKGINNIMNILEENKPKTMLSFEHRKGQMAQQIAYEMAFQYKYWDKPEEQKGETMLNFVNEWLKDKNFLYQQSEKYSNEKISSALKLLATKKDKTLSGMCQILTTQEVSFKEGSGLKLLFDNIENQNIRVSTIHKISHIEELNKEERAQKFIEFKNKLGTLPQTSLKIEFQGELMNALAKERPEIKEFIDYISAEAQEVLGEENAIKFLKQIGGKIEKIKSKETETPKVIQQAADHIKKDSSFLKAIGKGASFLGKGIQFLGIGALLFFMLFILAELKGVDMLVNSNIGKFKK